MTLLANSSWASLAKQTNQFDEVIPVDVAQLKRSLRYRFSMSRIIRKLRFGLLISPAYSRDFYVVDSIVRLSGASVKIGFRGDTVNIMPFLKKITDCWYSKLIEGDFTHLSELKKNAEFIKGLGGEGVLGLPKLRSSTSQSKNSFVHNDYFVIVPGGSWKGRCWPIEKFTELARRIQNKYSIPGFICGTWQERTLGDSINKGLEIPLTNLCGQTSISELIDFFANARLLITNETGSVHLGVAVGAPTICILGGGHFGRFFPYPNELMPETAEAVSFPMDCYGCNWDCRFKFPEAEAVPCVQSISVDVVWQAAVTQLEKSNKVCSRNAVD
ncbi:glycosyltransferase family 9 protein [Polynucleobacter paneuropaeus]|uniref:glycosyltransferase family 9 protein n=1 Tax=Polynucleobacter paneuropaeus TaxID=2527775 RepID=UPI001314BD93|nr:glycosyltransferase family 9 protein [Polynucleobacter paneuropaeus]